MKPETAKPATADTVGRLRKSEQLGRRLNSRNSEPSPQKQGASVKRRIILVLWSVAALISAGCPR